MSQILDILRAFAIANEGRPVTNRQAADALGLEPTVCANRTDHLRKMGCLRNVNIVKPFRWEVTAEGHQRLSEASIAPAEVETRTLIENALRTRPALQTVWA